MCNYVALEQREGHRKHSLRVFLSLGLFLLLCNLLPLSLSHPQVTVLKANTEENTNLDATAATSAKLATGKREQAGAKNARKVRAKTLACKATKTTMYLHANVCACGLLLPPCPVCFAAGY